MARADYFDRAVQAARHVLGELDQDAFLAKTDGHTVAIAFDGKVAGPEARAAVDLLVRLTARFYPQLAVVALDATAARHVRPVIRLAREINPKISVQTTLDNVQDAIVVGTTPVSRTHGREDIYIGSDGWIASISRHSPVGSGISGNPLGAGAAACIAAANVFRSIFSAAPRDEHISFSLLDLDPEAKAPPNPRLTDVDFGQAFLIGAGAIGNGFLWALSRSEVSGELAIVDHDRIDLGNMQRYVLSSRRHEGMAKTEVAEITFAKHRGISIYPMPHRWEDLMNALREDQWKFERVVVALDSPEDRIGVQASLPKWIVNAWTQRGEVGVSRHDFLGDQACMACLYVPREEVPHEDQLIVQALGLPAEETKSVRAMIETGRGVDREMLTRIANSKSVPLEKILPFEGQPIRTLYTKAVCSGTVMELANGPVIAQAEVPMPFQSALAGILEAAALFAHASGLPSCPTVTQIDLMRRFPNTRLFSRPEQKAVDRCFCTDEIFQDVYRAKYVLDPSLEVTQ